MRPLACCLVAVAVLFALAARPPAVAISDWTLLKNAAVRRDLRLTAEQQEEVDVILRKIETPSPRRTADPPANGPGATDFVLQERAISEAVIANSYRQLHAILSERQRRRLWQINAQASGSAVFDDSHVQRVLQLTADQRRQMEALSEKLLNDALAAVIDTDPTFAEVFSLAHAVTQKSYEGSLALLTTQQREDLDQLLGERFDLKLLRE